MKILIISSVFPPHVFGGAEIAAYNLARLLVARGHDVNVVTSYEGDGDFDYGKRAAEGYRLYHLRVPRTHTLFRRTAIKSTPRKLFWHLQDYFDPRNARQLQQIISAIRPDHIDIQNIMGLGFNALTVLADDDATVSYALHDYALACFQTTMHKNDSRCRRRCTSCKVVGDLRQYFLGNISRLGFISPSRAHFEELQKFVPILRQCPVLVLKNVPDTVAQPGVVQDVRHPIRLVYVGRLEDVKGIRFLLDVLSELSSAYDFHLTVLGTGSQEEQLREKFADKEWVSFHGFVHRADVSRALEDANLYCMPSLWAETYGMTTAESLRLGLPVIGSDTGGTKELVRDGVTGRLVEPGNKQAWVQAFRDIFESPELLKQWNSNALRLASEFSWSRIGEQYEQFVERLRVADNAPSRTSGLMVFRNAEQRP